MKPNDFEITVPAKWVFSGEHSVLKGVSALAFPHPEFKLSLSFQGSPPESAFKIAVPGQEEPLQALFARAQEWMGLEKSTPSGILEIESTIPIGSGMGSSAALCVAMARFSFWLAKAEFSIEKCIALATHLEDVFHGKSSGMDVSVIAYGVPIFFSIEEKSKLVPVQTAFPKFKFFDSGFRGKTIDCVQQVMRWRESFPEKSLQVDQQMGAATQMALTSNGNPALIAQAMNQAQKCFETWGLITPEMMSQKESFFRKGARAVKITGAGLGGFWVVLD